MLLNSILSAPKFIFRGSDVLQGFISRRSRVLRVLFLGALVWSRINFWCSKVLQDAQSKVL